MTDQAQICTAIRELFGDLRRSAAETKNQLEEIAELAQELADTITVEDDE